MQIRPSSIALCLGLSLSLTPALAQPTADAPATTQPEATTQPAATATPPATPIAGATDAEIVRWLDIAEEAMGRLEESALLKPEAAEWAAEWDDGDVAAEMEEMVDGERIWLRNSLALNLALLGEAERAAEHLRLGDEAEANVQAAAVAEGFEAEPDIYLNQQRAAALAALDRGDEAEMMVHAAANPGERASLLSSISMARLLAGDRDTAWTAAERSAQEAVDAMVQAMAAGDVDDALRPLLEDHAPATMLAFSDLGEYARAEELAGQLWDTLVREGTNEARPAPARDGADDEGDEEPDAGGPALARGAGGGPTGRRRGGRAGGPGAGDAGCGA